MKTRDLMDLEWRLGSLCTYAKDIAALSRHDSPEISDKFDKIAKFADKLGTFIRLNQELPQPSSSQKTIAIIQPVRRLKG